MKMINGNFYKKEKGVCISFHPWQCTILLHLYHFLWFMKSTQTKVGQGNNISWHILWNQRYILSLPIEILWHQPIYPIL